MGLACEAGLIVAIFANVPASHRRFEARRGVENRRHAVDAFGHGN